MTTRWLSRALRSSLVCTLFGRGCICTCTHIYAHHRPYSHVAGSHVHVWRPCGVELTRTRVEPVGQAQGWWRGRAGYYVRQWRREVEAEVLLQRQLLHLLLLLQRQPLEAH